MKKDFEIELYRKKVSVQFGDLEELMSENGIPIKERTDDTYALFFSNNRGPHNIFISKTANDSSYETLDSIIHEILHALLKIKNVNLSYKKEEEIVATISRGLSDALVRNGDLWKIAKTLVGQAKKEKEIQVK